jgi:hypothetical protein
MLKMMNGGPGEPEHHGHHDDHHTAAQAHD